MGTFIYAKDIQTVCLPSVRPISSLEKMLSSLDGEDCNRKRKLKIKGQQPNALQQATIQVIPQATCNQFWIQSPSPVSNQHVCATAAGKDTCSGDSGGPMIAQLTEASTTWIQIGITSFRNRCPADKNRPSVYANVPYFRDWIDRYMTDE
uniref:Peptidase S1 domain-containing protein n=1 Tax=Daphnia galeata TaxID=27404 RepID=A0A8J2RNH2_9CRUS|nr:unnamed protein product [Daphnia galeata]